MNLRSIDRQAIDWLDRRFYPGVPENWDNDHFRSLVLEHLDDDATLLDIGAGRGALPHMDFRGCAAQIIGIDPDPAVLGNPYLDQAFVTPGESMPMIDDDSIDVVVSNNVLEHLPDAAGFFREVARVLRPGGRLITKTPNRNHYMATIARCTPTSFHERVTAWRGRPIEDTFPTTYPANRIADQARLAAAASMRLIHHELVESRPEYLRFTAPLYMPGILWERTVNRFGIDGLKIVIFSVFLLPEEAATG